MTETSSSFRRGIVVGVLLWAAVVGLGFLMADVPAFIPESIKIFALINLAAGFGGAGLVYRRERRARRLGTI